MFADTEPEIARLGEVPPLQFIFLDFQSSLEDFFGFGTSDGDVDGDFLVTTDTKCSDGVAGFACEGTSEQCQRMNSIALSAGRSEVDIDGCGQLQRTVDWSLTTQLLKHFGSTGQSVTGFADGDVEDEFLDAELAHRVCALVSA